MRYFHDAIANHMPLSFPGLRGTVTSQLSGDASEEYVGRKQLDQGENVPKRTTWILKVEYLHGLAMKPNRGREVKAVFKRETTTT